MLKFVSQTDKNYVIKRKSLEVFSHLEGFNLDMNVLAGNVSQMYDLLSLVQQENEEQLRLLSNFERINDSVTTDIEAIG